MTEREIVAAVDREKVADIGRGGAVVEAGKLWDGDEGRRVGGDGRVPGGAVVEVFGERVVGAELQAVGEGPAQIDFEAVVDAGPLRDPGRGVGECWIGLDGRRVVDGSGSHASGA